MTWMTHTSCPECGRRYSYPSDQPIPCPFTATHGQEEPRGKERVDRYKRLKRELPHGTD